MSKTIPPVFTAAAFILLAAHAPRSTTPGHPTPRPENPIADLPQPELKARLQSILGTTSAHNIDPQIEIESETDQGDHLRRLITYWVEPGDRASAWLLLPKPLPNPANPRPLILCLHPTIPQGMDGPVGLTNDPNGHYALHLVRRGFICFAPDEFCFGRRVPLGAEPINTTDFYRRHPDWSAAGKAVWDLQRALDFLVKLDEIDPRSIGAIGHSHGGHNALMLAALDPRIKATVVNCGPRIMRADPNRALWSRPDPKDYIYYPRLRPTINRPADLPFDFDQAAMLVMPRSLFIIMNYIPPEQAETRPWTLAAQTISRRATRLGAPDAFKLHHFPGRHKFRQKSRERAYNWLEARLDPTRQVNRSSNTSSRSSLR